MYYSPEALGAAIREKSSYLCIGLDPDLQKFPSHLQKVQDPIFEFCKQIIDVTQDLCISYKPNLAFFEAQGPRGMEVFGRVCEYIPSQHFVIGDAKRGDIGNTASKYAEAFYEMFGVDALTVNPYMGLDTIQPFLDYKNKYAVVLALTSNLGAEDFQKLSLESGEKLYERVILGVKKIAPKEKAMFVVGATQANSFQQIRQLIPDHYILVPGVGSQGGSLEDVSRVGFSSTIGLIVNASRSIIYASQDKNFASEARKSAKAIQQEMETLLDKYAQ